MTENERHNKVSGRSPRIHFLSDRNFLSDQAKIDFGNLDEDSMVRITPEELAWAKKQVPTSRDLYFTIYQTFMGDDGSGEPYYKQYPATSSTSSS